VEFNSVADLSLPNRPLVNPVRHLFRLKNSKLTEERFEKWVQDLDPSYRFRYVFSHADKLLEISGLNGIRVQVAISKLKETGTYVKEIPFKSNSILNRIREMKYEKIRC